MKNLNEAINFLGGPKDKNKLFKPKSWRNIKVGDIFYGCISSISTKDKIIPGKCIITKLKIDPGSVELEIELEYVTDEGKTGVTSFFLDNPTNNYKINTNTTKLFIISQLNNFLLYSTNEEDFEKAFKEYYKYIKQS